MAWSRCIAPGVSATTNARSAFSTTRHWEDCSMDSRPDSPQRWGAPLAVASTAALWWLAAGLHPLWWAAWLAPVPLLVYALRARARWAALATVLAFGLGGMTLWSYIADVIRLPPAACVQIILTPALLMVPPVLLFR